MDAIEIARLPRDKTPPELLRAWAKVLDIPSGRFVNEDLEAAADALEQAQKERDGALDEIKGWKILWGEYDQNGNEIADIIAQRDAAQKDAKDARALLGEAAEWLDDKLCSSALRARIEAMLEKKI